MTRQNLENIRYKISGMLEFHWIHWLSKVKCAESEYQLENWKFVLDVMKINLIPLPLTAKILKFSIRISIKIRYKIGGMLKFHIIHSQSRVKCVESEFQLENWKFVFDVLKINLIPLPLTAKILKFSIRISIKIRYKIGGMLKFHIIHLKSRVKCAESENLLEN
jgi:hypothetical protein